jgi:hypothetical protein
MSSTTQLGLPLVQPAQAQKHVTVNQTFQRLDGLVQLVLQSQSVTVPPAVVTDGICYGVPPGAVSAWSGQAGKLAIGAGGGWDFAAPRLGWRALILDEGAEAVHDGTGWLTGQVTLSPKGAGLSLRVREVDFTLPAGAVALTAVLIPANAVVFGVTARVVTAITGTLTSWQLGNPGAVGRYGSGLGLAQGAFARGVLGQPTAFYVPTALQLDATGGSFAGGVVRIAVHYLELSLPQP